MTMGIHNKLVLRFIISLTIFLIVGVILLAVGVYALFEKQIELRLASIFLFLLGSCLLNVVRQRTARVFNGKTILQEVVSLPLPGMATHELTVPAKLSGGRLLLFFEDTTEKYNGKITLSKSSENGPSVSIHLPRLEPVRLKAPKWLATMNAGRVYEHWPRRTGQSTDPAILQFSFMVEPEEKLKLRCELELNFKGTKLEKRFPITHSETVWICIKAQNC